MRASRPRKRSPPRILATYESDDGTGLLVGQRINVRVSLSDVPAGDAGKV